MSVKTITLTGTEVMVGGLRGSNAHIRNDGTQVIYASAASGIVPGADRVLAIPAGASAALYGISGRLFLAGSGSAAVISSDYVESPFKFSVTSGSVTDAITRAVSNPNLLINPDFAVNQRGQNTYSAGYTVDCWKLFGSASATVNSGGSVTFASDGTEWAELRQTIEKGLSERLDGKILSLSAVVDGVLYCGTSAEPFDKTKNYTPLSIDCGDFSISLRNIPTNQNSLFARIGSSKEVNIIIEFIKLEIGGEATLFNPPDPATELAKCQRYYQIRSRGDIPEVDLSPTMCSSPTLTQLANGNYAYSTDF